MTANGVENVKLIVDSSIFLDFKNEKTDTYALRNAYKNVVKVANKESKVVHSKCV